MVAKRVLIISGEASGDHHGAKLVTAVRRFNPDVQFLGMGGEHMRAAGVDIRVDAKEMAVVGAIEIIRHIVPIFRAWRTLTQIIRKQSPDLLVLIDYPTFNLMLAKLAKKRGIKVLYYISPQVWAWHRSRVKTIAQRVDKMLVVFPFEEPLYREQGMAVEYVGHPLAGIVRADKNAATMREEWQIPAQVKVIGLLPGSRQGEIRRLLPTLLTAAAQLQQRYPDAVFVLPLANSLSADDLAPYLAQSNVSVRVIPQQFYNTVQLCDAAIVTSGTATLEVALLGVPMVIVYKTAASTYHIVKRIIQIPHIGLCNIVAGKTVVKELIQHEANPDTIAAEIGHILDDAGYRQQMQQDLQAVKQRLGEGGGTERAARALLEMLG